MQYNIFDYYIAIWLCDNVLSAHMIIDFFYVVEVHSSASFSLLKKVVY